MNLGRSMKLGARAAGVAWHPPCVRPFSSAGGPGRLAGRNIFELRAVPQANAAGTATEAPPSPATGHKTTPQQQATAPAPQEAYVSLPTSDESETLLRIRHSVGLHFCLLTGKGCLLSAHMMAMAVQKLYKDAQVTIGPWIDRGFYYDFDIKQPLTDKELKQIKKEMQKIAKAKLPFIREDVSKEEAERRIKEINEPYKLEILESILSRNPDAEITIYHIGEKDHPMHWSSSRATRSLLNAAPSALFCLVAHLWHYLGDPTAWSAPHPPSFALQRIYGTAWETPQQLEAYIKLKEEAARRDHRKLGQELDLFSLQETAGGVSVARAMCNLIATYINCAPCCSLYGNSRAQRMQYEGDTDHFICRGVVDAWLQNHVKESISSGSPRYGAAVEKSHLCILKSAVRKEFRGHECVRAEYAFTYACTHMCTHTHTGGGLVFWHGNGAMIRHQIESFWKDLHLQQGYNLVYSPHVAKIDLWKTSGHFDFYRESMFDQMQVRAASVCGLLVAGNVSFQY
eukprot:1159194-Pelagomonas_calceolata.AAC.2